MKEEYRSIVADCEIINSLSGLKDTFNCENRELTFFKSYIYTQLQHIIYVLQYYGFIKVYNISNNLFEKTTFTDFSQEYYTNFINIQIDLLETGKIASSISEIHPLVISKLLIKHQYLRNLNGISVENILVGVGSDLFFNVNNSIYWYKSSNITNIFTSVNSLLWNEEMWLALGAGTGTMAYSINGVDWVSLGNSSFSVAGYSVSHGSGSGT